MRRREFESLIKKEGFKLRGTGKHKVWVNENKNKHIAVPKGGEINKMIVKRLLKEIKGEV